MFSYRDMTFCDAERCKYFGDGTCHRALTNKVRDAAKAWWNSFNTDPDQVDQPLISIFMTTPDCFEMKERKK